MRAVRFAVWAVASIIFAGCSSHGGGPEPSSSGSPADAEDGALCDGTPADRVHIEIRYADDGTPEAIPAECVVRSGTRVVWRTRTGGAAFELEFQGGSPGLDVYATPEREQRDFHSRNQDGRQKVGISAKDVSHETGLKYDVVANGRRLDPAIIIRPR